MSKILLNCMHQESFKLFKKRIEKIPYRMLKNMLADPLSLDTQEDYRLLAQLMFKEQSSVDLDKKFGYVLEKLSQLESFDLSQYLNSYHVSNTDLDKGNSLYFAACFRDEVIKMELLCKYGYNPETSIINDSGEIVTAQNVIGKCSLRVINKHKEMITFYRMNKLDKELGNKDEVRKMKI